MPKTKQWFYNCGPKNENKRPAKRTPTDSQLDMVRNRSAEQEARFDLRCVNSVGTVTYNALLDRNCKDFVRKKHNLCLFQKQGLVDQGGYVLEREDLDGKGVSLRGDAGLGGGNFFLE